ncbi:hypothetical protein [Falsiroseomonas tokyonensis]|uniref:Uncharacterized protein n=1 Tax=Falsiroseomonas tokyonensis TaxID=430521 RepID=A0ABV7BS38_9PROT|nr:hypothetical protein [Falsiroseomonas tokyonensis]MBU8537467.1 hypothetical protein [Falsiroseomonas tokyonensis]
MLRLCLVPLLALWMGWGAAAAQVVEGSYTLGGKVVALPPGPWRVIFQDVKPGRSRELTTPTTLHRTVLLQEVGGRAAGVILASAATEVGQVWTPHGVCTRADTLRRHIEVAVQGNLDCRGLLNQGAGAGPTTPDWVRSLYTLGEDRPGFIPPRWIVGQVVLSEGMHLLQVDYRFAPAAYATGTARNAGNWSDGMRSAEQTTFLDRVDAFTLAARAELRRGLYGRSPAAPLAF